jgi:hypothetical protein
MSVQTHHDTCNPRTEFWHIARKLASFRRTTSNQPQPYNRQVKVVQTLILLLRQRLQPALGKPLDLIAIVSISD